jgi:3,4-dihydroxy-9,10-secoandrosta-1,3,5(10)-triene-9,17-dione 4,5-dioxygenase
LSIATNTEESTLAINSLGYLGISSRNIAEWRTFGTQVLGLQDVSTSISNGDDTVFLKMDDHPFRLFAQAGDADQLSLIGWETVSEQALLGVSERLTVAGTTWEWGSPELCTVRRVQSLISFRDPSGMQHEAFWGRVSDFAVFNSPVGVAGFVTGDQGLGHVVLPAAQFDDMAKFFSEVLGFGLSDLMKIRFTPDPEEPVKRLWFMHCNRRHHSLGLFEMPMPAQCVHLMLEVKNVDEVGRCNDRCIQSGTPLTGTLGRHCNDHMVSFYMRSPGGFDIEYGAEGRTIDDWSHYAIFESTATSYWGHDFSIAQTD